MLLWAVLARACVVYSSSQAAQVYVTPACLPSQVAMSVRYHISYCNIYAMHIYVSFIFLYILLNILVDYIHLVQ